MTSAEEPQNKKARVARRVPGAASPAHTTAKEGQSHSGEDGIIRIGSDCSGLGTEVFAMGALGLEHRMAHMSTSEIDKALFPVDRRHILGRLLSLLLDLAAHDDFEFIWSDCGITLRLFNGTAGPRGC